MDTVCTGRIQEGRHNFVEVLPPEFLVIPRRLDQYPPYADAKRGSRVFFKFRFKGRPGLFHVVVPDQQLGGVDLDPAVRLVECPAQDGDGLLTQLGTDRGCPFRGKPGTGSQQEHA